MKRRSKLFVRLQKLYDDGEKFKSLNDVRRTAMRLNASTFVTLKDMADCEVFYDTVVQKGGS